MTIISGYEHVESGVFDDIPESVEAVVAENVDLKEAIFRVCEMAHKAIDEEAAKRLGMQTVEHYLTTQSARRTAIMAEGYVQGRAAAFRAVLEQLEHGEVPLPAEFFDSGPATATLNGGLVAGGSAPPGVDRSSVLPVLGAADE